MPTRKAALADYGVDCRLVGLQRSIGADVLFDGRLNGAHFSIFDGDKAKSAATLNHAKNNVALVSLDIGTALAGLLGSQIGFIGLDYTREQSAFLHGLADSVA